jgi:hypothetical protein
VIAVSPEAIVYRWATNQAGCNACLRDFKS